MKIIISIIAILLISVNCSSSKSSYSNVLVHGECIENLDFKKVYFSHIGIIDSLVSKSQNKEFEKSLLFVSKYAHVTAESMLNYARSYPIVVYREDRKGWLEWYEKNKCNNIQFKKK